MVWPHIGHFRSWSTTILPTVAMLGATRRAFSHLTRSTWPMLRRMVGPP